MVLEIRKCKEGIRFSATIQPRSSQNKISGLLNNTLKIHLTAPPVDGSANRMCVKFLSKVLGISPSKVSIAQGLTGKNKVIQIEGMDEVTFLKKIQITLKNKV
ncbi:MAG: DUF167 domain-containing protein [Nitrospinales bacterium]